MFLKKICFIAAGFSMAMSSIMAYKKHTNIYQNACIEDGGVQTQEHIADQLELYLLQHHNDGVAQEILNIFQAQTTDPTAINDFHPNLPNGCAITDRYTRMIDFGSKVVHVMVVEINYREFFFLLEYMVFSNGQMRYLVAPQITVPL